MKPPDGVKRHNGGVRVDLTQPDRPALSIVIPAYNEEQRLARTLSEVDAYLRSLAQFSEIIVADDGSTDHTIDIVKAFEPSFGIALRVLTLPHRGKANAVREGVMAALGRIILFTDADLSTPMSYAPLLLASLEQDVEVAIGSREGSGARRVGEPWYRHVMGRIFNRVVRVLALPGIDDTQCGFKAFQRQAALEIFDRTQLHSQTDIHGPRVSGFDVEVLFLARRLGYRIAEIPVYWQHAPGSKVRPLLDPFRMFGDVIRVRFYALSGRYRNTAEQSTSSVEEESDQ